MNFETLINSPKEVIKEYLEKPESLKEIGCSISQVGELIKVAGESITYVENFEKFKDILDIFIDEENFSDDDAKELGRIVVELIKDTGKVEEYLNNEEMMKARIWAIHFKSNRKNRRIFNPRKISRARVDGW